jgi:hypothetical protein
MFITIICLTILFLMTKSYVYRFDNYRHTIVRDKNSANVVTPMNVVFLQVLSWILDIFIIYFLYRKYGIIVTIIVATVVNLTPKVLCLFFPFPRYYGFLKNSKRRIIENVKDEYLTHPEIQRILNEIDEKIEKRLESK